MWRECISTSLTKREVAIGGAAVVISLLFVYFALVEVELMTTNHNHFVPLLSVMLDEQPQVILRTSYIVLAVSTPISAILLIIGVIRHNKWLLIPWLVILMLVLAMTCAEFWVITLPTTLGTASIGFLVYIIFAILALYHRLEQEERDELQKQKRGIQVAHTEQPVTASTYDTLEEDSAVPEIY